MFYNCPVRKLASHSPPSCEKKKKTIHIQTHALTGTYILTRVDTYRLRHTCRDIQATQAPAGITFSQVGTGLLGEDWRQYYLSLSLTSLEGPVPHSSAKTASVSALGMLPPPLPCVLALGYSVCPRQAQAPGPPVVSVFIAG